MYFRFTAYLDLNPSKLKSTALIDIEESSKILSKYISDVIEKELHNIKDKGGNLQDQVSLVNKIVTTLVVETGENYLDDFYVDKNSEQLLALLDRENNIYAIDDKAKIIRPESSISQSSLFTGAVRESSMALEHLWKRAMRTLLLEK